jgi:UDPglucose 6-dehydrogenase
MTPHVWANISPGRARDLVHVERCASAVEAARDADVVVIATEWPEFSGVDIAAVAAAMRGRALVDMRNLLDPSAVRAAGLTYDGVGRS